ncbi:hypothetical protein [Streptomyces sp. PTY087I2]|uniref:hypothetical protein n=1 Tax=Streptomyces sp. PTY087I2 TaxID=1819298 RepID=UPI00159EC2FF|nr:hypothetical protein [Streptomyces sp. PTY087I2]
MAEGVVESAVPPPRAEVVVGAAGEEEVEVAAEAEAEGPVSARAVAEAAPAR